MPRLLLISYFPALLLTARVKRLWISLRSLSFENPDKIEVLSYKPSLVSSNLFKVEPRFEILSSIEAANSALDKLGWDTETQGHWRHVLTNVPLNLMTSVLPEKTSMGILQKMIMKIGE